jgi:hypothetical protein
MKHGPAPSAQTLVPLVPVKAYFQEAKKYPEHGAALLWEVHSLKGRER